MWTDQEIQYVEKAAEGMSRQEVLDLLGRGDLENLSGQDMSDFELAYRKGRANMLYYSVGNLKHQMVVGKNCVQACLAALSQFGTEWERSKEVSGAKSFKVILDE